MTRARLLLVLGVSVATFGIASAVQAGIPDTGGVIHGCYLKANGSLRVIDSGTVSCKSSETPLDWNQPGVTGPTGLTGAAGPTGRRGATGAAGPKSSPDAWADDGSAGLVHLVTLQFTTVDALTLPAGSFFLQAETNLEDTTVAQYQCRLEDTSGVVGSTEIVDSSFAFEHMVIPVHAVTTLASPDTVEFQCLTSGPSSQATGWEFDAVTLGTVH